MTTGGLLDGTRPSPRPDLCTVRDCFCPRATDSQFCAAHEAAFRAKSELRAAESARVPAYLRGQIGRPDGVERIAPPKVTLPAPAPWRLPTAPAPKAETAGEGRPCSVPGCDKPRYKHYWRCEEHQRFYWRERDHAKRAGRNEGRYSAGLCAVEGCDQPRWTEHSYCQDHQREKWRQRWHRRRKAA